MKILRHFVTLFLLAAASSAYAGPIFDINLDITESGSDEVLGSISGTLTTNGNMGFLTGEDIVGFELLLTIGGDSFQFTRQEGDRIQADGLRTTDVGLVLDFNSQQPFFGAPAAFSIIRTSGPFVDFQRSPSSLSVIQSIGFPNMSGDMRVNTIGSEFTDRNDFSVGTNQGMSVPAPAMLPMLAVFLVGLGFVRRRNLKAQFINQGRLRYEV